MKKLIIFFVLMLTIALSSCNGNLPSQDPLDYSINDRHDMINENKSEPVISNEGYSKTVTEIIEKFNTIASEDYEITEYTVTEDGDSYLIETESGDKYRLRVDSDGSLLGMSMLTGTSEEKAIFLKVTQELMKNNDFIPSDVRNDMDRIVDRVSEIKNAISEFINESE